uniref:Uncharacterized protein n=1 Tax=Mustela putorius furo TaxID=9669 RepID=M3YCC2_MUSPF
MACWPGPRSPPPQGTPTDGCQACPGSRAHWLGLTQGWAPTSSSPDSGRPLAGGSWKRDREGGRRWDSRSEERVGLTALCGSESGPGSRLRSPVTLHAPRSPAPPRPHQPQ